MPEKLISAIRVKGLFGLYTYCLPDQGNFSDAAILYGDNGVGKSTILRLAFHLLSAANDRGHRTALFNSQFQRLDIELTSGVELKASFSEKQDQRILSLSIVKDNKVLVIWDYQPSLGSEKYILGNEFLVEMSDNGTPILSRRKIVTSRSQKDTKVLKGEKAYISILEQYVPTIFILNADRRLDSDSVPDPSDEMELRRVMRYEEPKRINQLVSRSREIGLSQALSTAGKWIGKKAVIGANQGSMNVHSVYVDVLQHLVSPSPASDHKTIDQPDITDLIRQLSVIETKTNELSKYELATQLSTSEFRKSLNARAKNKKLLAAELLKPYIKSLEGRLQAVEPIYRIVDRFVTIVNGFLSDKSISFKLSQGFTIQNKLGNPLAPAQLSSGEQQLLLLFCYVLTARDNPSVFMIDEPEISLNIKWQRQLIQSLLDITEGATIQFIFASHSIELLAQHRNRVVKMVDQK